MNAITKSVIVVLATVSTSFAQTTTTTTTTTTTGDGNTPSSIEQPSNDGGNGNTSGFVIGARVYGTGTSLDLDKAGDGSAEVSFVFGYGVGGYLGYNFNKNFGLQLEGIYSSLAQKYTYQGSVRKVELSYINFPLLAVIGTDINRPVSFNVAFGPQAGINVGSKVTTQGDGEGTDSLTAVLAVKTGDFGLAYGAGLNFALTPTMHLGVGFRGVYGLIDVSDKSKNQTTNDYYILDRAHVKTYSGYLGIGFMF